MTSVLLLHDLGDPDGGSAWQRELEAGGLSIAAPILPGHAGAEPVPGRCYLLGDPAVVAAQWFAAEGIETVDVVVGVGASGWSAQVIALAGRANRLVMVDGLGGPFLQIDELMARRRATIRAMAAHVDNEPVGGSSVAVDPRIEYAARGHHDRDLAQRAAESMAVPTLVIESGSSPTEPGDVELLAPAFPADVMHAASPSPVDVASLIVRWLDAPAPR